MFLVHASKGSRLTFVDLQAGPVFASCGLVSGVSSQTRRVDPRLAKNGSF